MDIYSLRDDVQSRLQAIGGDAGLLDDTTIVLSWNGMTGLVIGLPKGEFFLKVSTPWGDADEETAELAEDVSGRVVQLFQGFWERRGIKFRK
jgi:hypothetical protein